MKIVVTGAMGHIGSRLVRQIPTVFSDSEIFMIDSMLTQRYPSLFNLPENARYRFFEDDVVTMDLDSVIKGADAVVHLAAITDAAGSFDKKEQVEENNYNATTRIADACVRVGSPLIHLSSTSVYGTQDDVVDEECSKEELQPQSPYAETKLKEETYLTELSDHQNFRYIICRFGTICGVSPGMRFHTAVNKFCWQAIMGQPLTIWKTALHQKRPYLTLDDAINAICFIMENNHFCNKIYNVLTDNKTVNDIVNSIKEKVDGVQIDYVESKIMNQLSYEVISQRFQDLGFHFGGSIHRSIVETIELLRQANQR